MAGPLVENSNVDSNQIVEVLINDLRILSTEARRKHEILKDAAEASIVLVRNISTNSPSQILHSNLVNKSMDILHPFLLGCGTRNPKIVQISLQSMQKMLQYRMLSAKAAPAIVDRLWELAEAECEELRVLQTITLFVSSDLFVTGSNLSKCILIAIKMNFSKDPSVINAASASVRQLFSCVYERVVQEDGINNVKFISFPLASDVDYNESYGSLNSAEIGIKMNICAADGYLLLKDLISLIRKESTFWLEGVKKFTVTLALELLESIIKSYPSMFFRHAEYAIVLRDLIYQQIIHLMTGCKFKQSKNETFGLEKPPFPLQMRCFRIGLAITKNYYEIIGCDCRIFINYMVNLLSYNKTEWQAAAAMEVLHKLVGQPEILRYFAQNENTSEEIPIMQAVIEGVSAFCNRTIRKAADDDPVDAVDQQQPGFLCGENFLPVHENVTAKRWILLDWLEKHEAAPVSLSYLISLAYGTLTDFTNSCFALIEELNSPTTTTSNGNFTEETRRKNATISADFFKSVFKPLVFGLLHLLNSSIEDSVTESILNCLSTVGMIACRTKVEETINGIFRVLCRFSLPRDYFFNFIDEQSTKCRCDQNSNAYNLKPMKMFCLDHIFDANTKLDQVVAVSTACPTSNDSNPKSYSLMAKNMDVARTLISTITVNGQYLEETWDIVLTTLQHFSWLLGMKFLPNGGHRSMYDTMTSDNAAPPTSVNILTTAVTNELPELYNMLAKLFDSTITYSDVILHHVIATLCKLSSEQTAIAQKSTKGSSFFAVSKLTQLAVVNQFRLEVFWRPITAHLIDISTHNDLKVREFGCAALTHLITSSFKYMLDEMQKAKEFPEKITDRQTPEEFAKRQAMIMNAVVQLTDIQYLDVRERQLNCVGFVFQCGSGYLFPDNWLLVINIIQRFPIDPDTNEHLIESAYSTCSQICSEFWDVLPFECLLLILRTVTDFAKQKKVVNIALNSTGLLWQVSDHVALVSFQYDRQKLQKFWFILFQCLSELCLDSRPPLRKSAGDTLLQTIACHGDLVDTETWHEIFYDILFPLATNVLNEARDASTEKTDASNSGSENFLVHHSRDTPAKQWAETTVRILAGIVRIFNSQRPHLELQDDFFTSWMTILHTLECAATFNNPEISLAGLNAFLELHLGKIASDVPENAIIKSKKAESDIKIKADSPVLSKTPSTTSKDEEVKENESGLLPPLPTKFYCESFNICCRIGEVITFARVFQGTIEVIRFLPNSYHFSTYLKCFLILFIRIKNALDPIYLKNGFLNVLKRIACAPRSPDQPAFQTTNTELSPTHEAVYETLNVILKENLKKSSPYQNYLPHTLRLLFEFSNYSIKSPSTDFIVHPSKILTLMSYNLTPFAELCLKTAVDTYRKSFSWRPVIEEKIFVDFVKTLKEPLSLRYSIPDQNIWMNALTSFNEVSRLSFNVVRDNVQLFDGLWDVYADVLDKFIFCKNRGMPLNSDERRRYEFYDCQMVDTVRSQILTHANKLPWRFMHRVIDILNRASVITLDHTDVMDMCDQRTDLSRVSFEALLSLSNTQVPEHFVVSNGVDSSLKKPDSLGVYAISLILLRCKNVLNDYARDERNAGVLPLTNARVCETVSVLRAIATLIEGLQKQPKHVIDSLHDRLVDVYPVVVQMVPCCAGSSDVQLSVMIALNSYKTLMNIR
uniref:Protein MON2 homolog n=1 Tax=Panagrolaimus sp. JU765 TaxID=591449 RepID=A0AC34Q294_9BILA